MNEYRLVLGDGLEAIEDPETQTLMVRVKDSALAVKKSELAKNDDALGINNGANLVGYRDNNVGEELDSLRATLAAGGDPALANRVTVVEDLLNINEQPSTLVLGGAFSTPPSGLISFDGSTFTGLETGLPNAAYDMTTYPPANKSAVTDGTACFEYVDGLWNNITPAGYQNVNTLRYDNNGVLYIIGTAEGVSDLLQRVNGAWMPVAATTGKYIYCFCHDDSNALFVSGNLTGGAWYNEFSQVSGDLLQDIHQLPHILAVYTMLAVGGNIYVAGVNGDTTYSPVAVYDGSSVAMLGDMASDGLMAPMIFKLSHINGDIYASYALADLANDNWYTAARYSGGHWYPVGNATPTMERAAFGVIEFHADIYLYGATIVDGGNQALFAKLVDGNLQPVSGLAGSMIYCAVTASFPQPDALALLQSALDSVSTVATTAQSTAASAQTTADAAAAAAAAAQSTASSAATNADTAQSTADTAQTTADAAASAAASAQSAATSAASAASAAQSTADSANTAASAAQSTANSASTAAAAAQSTANSASTAASAAQSTANSAQSAASAAQTTANSASSAAAAAQSTANSAASAAAAAQTTADAAVSALATIDGGTF